MSTCFLADGRCGRLGRPCASGQCIARGVRRLHERRWREKLGLFFVEGEDAVRDAWAIIAGASATPRRKETSDSAAKRVVLKVTPRKIASWDHSKLGGRY